MNAEIKHLRAVVETENAGSFSAAAHNLNIDVSVLSRTVRDLEASVGFLIFERLPRGVRPTIAGTAYIASARDILQRVERAGQEAFLSADGWAGRISLGFVWSFSSGPVVELLRAFRDVRPNISVRTAEASYEQLVARLKSADLDVVLVATDPPPYPRLVSVGALKSLPLWLEPLCVVVPQTCKSDAFTWFDLVEQQLLCQPQDDWQRFVAHVERLGGPTLQFRVQDVSREGLLGLVAAGLGWLIMPVSLVHHDMLGLRTVPIVSDGAALLIEALWHSRVDNAATYRFLEVARATFGPDRAVRIGEQRQSPYPLP